MEDNKNIVNNPTQTNPILHYPAWTNSPNHHSQPRPNEHHYPYWPNLPPGPPPAGRPGRSRPTNLHQPQPHPTSHYRYRNWTNFPPRHPGPALLGWPRPTPVQSHWQPRHHHEPYSATNNEQVVMHTLGRYPADSNWYMDTRANFHMTSHRGPRPRLSRLPAPRPVLRSPWQPTHRHEPYSTTNNEQVMHTLLGRNPVLGSRMDFSSKVAVKLLLKGIENVEKKNMLTSPLSYNLIMNLIAAGSSNDTLVQILRLLEHKNMEEVNSESSMLVEITSEQKEKGIKRRRIKDNHGNCDDGDGPVISVLNGAWLNKEYRLKDSFANLVENLYKAKVRNIDCNKPEMVVKEVNEWARASTKDLIKDVLQTEDIDEDTLLIVANALYFKGSWMTKFTSTNNRCFYLLNNEKIETPFMDGCKDYSVEFYEDCKVARIPYKNGGDTMRKFAMYILLPHEKDGLQGLLENVNSKHEFLSEHCHVPEYGNCNVDFFSIPKFKFCYLTGEAPEIMKGMELTLPFDVNNAEFHEMVIEEDINIDDKRIYVSKIVQKAFIEVNEEGTEAVTITHAIFGIIGGLMKPRETTEFIADHPFMFVIREDNSGVLFFVGTVLNPKEE